MLKKFLKLAGKIFAKPQNSAGSTKNYPNIPDSARSVSVGTVVEALCSGGKYGIQMFKNNDWGANTYLAETPIYRDGIAFFKGVIYDFRGGWTDAPALGGFYFGGMANESAVGSEIKYGLPITRAFINSNCTIIRCRFSFTLLKNRRENGNIVQIIGNSVTIQVSIKEKNTGFLVKPPIVIEGKYSDPYEQVFEWQVGNTQDNDEFIIKVERITPADGTDDTRVVTWSSYTEIIPQNLRLKRIAHVGIRFDADEFGTNFPERQYRIGGMFLDIPSCGEYNGFNGIPMYINYHTWNGQMKAFMNVACEDIGAIVWYLLLDEIDGLGSEVKEWMVDRYSLFAISFYNSQNIFQYDGSNRFEIRYRCNLVINKQDDGWKVIDSILSSCFARRYWEGGILKFTQDKPDSIFALVTNADIVGDFDYSSTDIDERATAVNVTWTDLDNFSKTRTEYINDPVLIAHQGYNLKNVEAVGCIDRSQANRYGRAIIYSENYESGVVTFKGRQYLAYVPIGKIVAISDSNTEQERIGGIITSISSNQITIDYPISIKPYQGFDEYFYLLLYPDVKVGVQNGTFKLAIDHYLRYGINEGRYPNGYIILVQTRLGVVPFRVLNPPGSYSVLSVEYKSELANTEPGANWILFSPENKHKTFRVLSKEIDDENLDYINITCTEYNEFKWAKIERQIDMGLYKNRNYTSYSIVPDVNSAYVLKTLAPDGNINLTVNWNKPINVELSKYIIGYAVGNNPITNSTIWNDTNVLYSTSLSSFTFNNLSPNWYAIRILVVNYQDEISRGVYINPLLYTNP